MEMSSCNLFHSGALAPPEKDATTRRDSNDTEIASSASKPTSLLWSCLYFIPNIIHSVSSLLERGYSAVVDKILKSRPSSDEAIRIHTLKRRIILHVLLSLVFSISWVVASRLGPASNKVFAGCPMREVIGTVIAQFATLAMIRSERIHWGFPAVFQVTIWVSRMLVSHWNPKIFWSLLIVRIVSIVDVGSFLLGRHLVILIAIAIMFLFEGLLHLYHPLLEAEQVPVTQFRVGGWAYILWSVAYRYATEAEYAHLYEEIRLRGAHKTAFLSKMSHEMRTPLVGIIGSADILWSEIEASEKGDSVPNREMLKEYTEIIKSCSHHLLDLINDVLEYSKLSAGPIPISETCVNIDELTHSAFNAVVPSAVLRGLKVQCNRDADVPRCVYTDEMRLRQVLLNLLSNAVKFTDAGSIILRTHIVHHCKQAQEMRQRGPESESLWSIRSPCEIDGKIYDHAVVVGRSIPEGTNVLVFTIEDTGIGLTKEFVESQMFSPFQQGHQGFTRGYGGTGLGLNIALHLVQAMGGAIRCCSSVGKGTRFDVCFPLRPCFLHRESIPTLDTTFKEGATEAGDTNDVDLTLPSRVLLAEDVPISQKILTRMLKSVGCEHVDAASNGEEVMRLVEKHGCEHYCAIFLDIEMPVMNGIETVQKLRQTEGFQRHYVCALTAHALDTTRDLLLSAGFDDWVPKPPTQENLAAALRRARQHNDSELARKERASVIQHKQEKQKQQDDQQNVSEKLTRRRSAPERSPQTRTISSNPPEDALKEPLKWKMRDTEAIPNPCSTLDLAIDEALYKTEKAKELVQEIKQVECVRGIYNNKCE